LEWSIICFFNIRFLFIRFLPLNEYWLSSVKEKSLEKKVMHIIIKYIAASDLYAEEKE